MLGALDQTWIRRRPARLTLSYMEFGGVLGDVLALLYSTLFNIDARH